jgi:hypothetical protein
MFSAEKSISSICQALVPSIQMLFGKMFIRPNRVYCRGKGIFQPLAVIGLIDKPNLYHNHFPRQPQLQLSAQNFSPSAQHISENSGPHTLRGNETLFFRDDNKPSERRGNEWH